MRTARLLPPVRGWRLGSLAAAGCGGDAVARYPVSGRVTFGGRPVPAGQVVLEPDARKGNHGPQGYAEIVDGRYDTTRSAGLGTMGGPHLARVTGFDGIKRSEDRPEGSPLFPEYRTEIDLPRAGHAADIEVPPAR